MTTEKACDNIDEAKSSVAVRIRGIRIKTSVFKNKSNIQQHLADVKYEGCYIFIYYLYCFMLRHFML